MPVALRLAVADDSFALGELQVAAWRESYRGIVPEEMLAALSAEHRASIWRRIVGAPDDSATMVHVVEIDGKLAGFAACGAQRDDRLRNIGYDGEITAIYVRRAFQHGGVGRLLICAAVDHLRACNLDAAAVWVLKDNVPARRFYDNLEGRLVGNRADVRGGTVLVEVAYGWLSSNLLRTRAAQPVIPACLEFDSSKASSPF